MSRHHGIDDAGTVYLARVQAETRVLGPGTRAAVWVQGCHLRCKGCIAAETHPLGGAPVPSAELAEWLALAAYDGATFSGGEPLLQARGLTTVIDAARELRPGLSLMLYTGYRLEWLRAKGSDAQRDLLERVDLLVDGPYIERRHAPLRWRGSSNQRLLDLSGRHAADLRPDEPAGLEFELDEGLGALITGVPPVPRFREWLECVTERGDRATSST